MANSSPTALRIALPKGRMQPSVFQLMAEAGIPVRLNQRDYRPLLDLPGVQAKLLKPQNIVEMLQAGSRDLGFTGRDWVQELDGELIEVLDTGLDPVRLVAAAPRAILEDGALPQRPIVVASEYETLTKRWIAFQSLEANFVRSYGATEVFPPEDADCIVDNTATGSTLRANGLEIVDELLTSSTCLYASPKALQDPAKAERIEEIVLVLRAVLEARQRVILELNVDAGRLEAVVEVLPCMREPTISQLHGDAGYAVKAAVPRRRLPELIPLLKSCGGTDLIVMDITQVVG